MIRTISAFVRRNSVDIWHLAVPVVLATIMGASSISGATGFLLVWAAARQVGRVSGHG